MLSVTITEKDGPTTTTTFDKTEVLIGRVKGNDVVLPKTNVSKRHSRIVVKDGKIILIDLKSTNGTFINGRKIAAPHVMQEGDKIFIGDFTIEVREVAGGAPSVPSPAAPVPGPMPSFGGIPSAAGLPTVSPLPPISAPNAPGAPEMGMGGMNPPHAPGLGGPIPSAPNFPRPNVPAPSMPGPAPMASIPEPAPIASPAGPAPIVPGPVGPAAPMGPGAGLSEPAGPGAGLSNSPSLGAGPAAGLGNAPSLGSVAPVGPSSAMASSPNLSPSPSISPSLGSSSPILNASSPSISSVGARSQAAGSSSTNEGVIDKSLRLPGSSQSERSTSSKSSSSRSNSNRKEIGTAALPEDIVVDDARTPESEAWLKAARIVMDNYLSKNDFQAILAQPYPPDPDSQDMCYNQLSQCVAETEASLGNVDIDSLLDFLLKEVCGLGAVDSLIDDPEVSTFTVYNYEMIVAERKGRREVSSLQFTSNDTLYLASQRLLAYQGINPQTAPAVSEIRFNDGTQIQVVLPPVAVASTNIVVRKPNHEFNAIAALIQRESLSGDMAKFLNLCVKARRNILIVGAQGAGRTSVLNALGAEIPDGERIVTVENSAVLIMPQPYVISLEAQNAAILNGDLASLVQQAGRLRAERVLVDAIQTPADGVAYLNAICAGAQGSMATISGLNGDEGISLLKRMISSEPSARALIGNVDIVVVVRAFTDARRRIVEISEVVADDNGGCSLVPIFAWCGSGMGNMAMGDGQFKALGNIPKFYKELERGGMALEPSIFNA